MKFGFIGAGKVGFSMGKYLTKNGQVVSGYFSENENDAVEAAEFTSSKCYKNMKTLVEDSDVIFLTVTDLQIKNVWNVIKDYHINNKIVCHCSGALSSEVFSDITGSGNYGYSIHPLFAVSDKYNSYKELSSSYFTIEGTKERLDDMVKLFKSFGNEVCVISKENKIKYHSAAAIASNLVVGLLALSEKLLTECGFEEKEAHEALKPIIEGNVKHVLNEGFVKALTGPIERNDISTVKKHLQVLENNDLEIYKSVSRQIVEVSKIKNPENNYNEMEEILR